MVEGRETSAAVGPLKDCCNAGCFLLGMEVGLGGKAVFVFVFVFVSEATTRCCSSCFSSCSVWVKDEDKTGLGTRNCSWNGDSLLGTGNGFAGAGEGASCTLLLKLFNGGKTASFMLEGVRCFHC